MDSTFRVQTMVAAPGSMNMMPVASMNGTKGISTLSAEKLTSQFSPQGWITTMKAEGKVQGHSLRIAP